MIEPGYPADEWPRRALPSAPTGGSKAAPRALLGVALAVAVAVAAPAQGAVQAAARTDRAAPVLDGRRLQADVRALAHDSMGGRRTGTPGNARARAYITRVFATIGLDAFAGGFERPFRIESRDAAGPSQGVNVVAHLRGTERPDRVIVITAHYDHLGERGGEIYNGADDNASGVAALLEIARALADSRPRHTIVFAALDAEEMGLRGARAFVDDPPVALAGIALNVNLDMVGRNEAGELWVAGTSHTPPLLPLVERTAATAPVRLRVGHDRPGVAGQDDWTSASDHGAFHARGIPFLYFGVEDHADYHRESDEFAAIDADFHLRAVRTIAEIVFALDAGLDGILPGR